MDTAPCLILSGPVHTDIRGIAGASLLFPGELSSPPSSELPGYGKRSMRAASTQTTRALNGGFQHGHCLKNTFPPIKLCAYKHRHAWTWPLPHLVPLDTQLKTYTRPSCHTEATDLFKYYESQTDE